MKESQTVQQQKLPLLVGRLTVRVYGILVDDQQRVLVADEFIRGDYFTKFPGGGLELGEGTRDCLVREFMEETNLVVTIGDHIYTTDFFQISAFNNTDQILSIYYHVDCNDAHLLATQTTPFNFEPHQVADPNGCSEVFRWIKMSELTEESVSLPIDKIVVRMMKEKHG